MKLRVKGIDEIKERLDKIAGWLRDVEAYAEIASITLDDFIFQLLQELP